MGYNPLLKKKYITQQVNPSQQLKKFKFNPWFITGFTDAEGCWNVSITKSKTHKLGLKVQLFFSIRLHKKDYLLLEWVKNFFSVGKIYIEENFIQLKVYSEKDLYIIINHFYKYPLITEKWADYELWKQIYNLIMRDLHLTKEGLLKIVAIKAAMNPSGGDLSDVLKEAFSRPVVPVARPKVRGENKTPIIYDPQWLAGFASGEGSFQVKIKKSATHKLKEKVTVEFNISQHSRDKNLINYFKNYLDCGNINISKTRPSEVYFSITKLEDILYKIIPFFKKHPIVGVKALDFADFCKVADMMRDNKHLSKEGLEKIKQIKAGMNTGRKSPTLLKVY